MNIVGIIGLSLFIVYIIAMLWISVGVLFQILSILEEIQKNTSRR